MMQRISTLMELVAVNVPICPIMKSRLAKLHAEMELPKRRATMGLHHLGCSALAELNDNHQE